MSCPHWTIINSTAAAVLVNAYTGRMPYPLRVEVSPGAMVELAPDLGGPFVIFEERPTTQNPAEPWSWWRVSPSRVKARKDVGEQVLEIIGEAQA